MPVFLVPIVVGGYYYLKNKKEGQEEDDTSQQQQQQQEGEEEQQSSTTRNIWQRRVERAIRSRVRPHQQQRQNTTTEEESSAIEVSFKIRPQECAVISHSSYQTSLSAGDTTATNNESPTSLLRKESSDTAKTECSEESMNNTQPEEIENEGGRESELGNNAIVTSCTDCDIQNIFEFVECEKNDCDTCISTCTGGTELKEKQEIVIIQS